VRKPRLIPRLRLKIHHIGLGGIVSFFTGYLLGIVPNFESISDILPNLESIVGIDPLWITVLSIGIPVWRLYNHNRTNTHARHSTLTCFSGGHGIVFTILYLIFQYNLTEYLLN